MPSDRLTSERTQNGARRDVALFWHDRKEWYGPAYSACPCVRRRRMLHAHFF